MIILYTIDCPKCKVLETLLKKNNLEYESVHDVELMVQKGFKDCPKLEIDGKLYNFAESVKMLREGKVC